jgi:protein phosphatase
MIAGKSDKGMLRSQNEDAYCIINGSDGAPLLFAVADGMGGHLAGDIASQTAIAVIHESLEKKPLDTENGDAVSSRLSELVNEANERIYGKSLTEPDCYGMGTTLVIAAETQGQLTIAHVGDSCAYYLRDGEMHKITTDHTYVEELIRIGSLTREEAARHPKRNIITKVVGCMGSVKEDIYRVELKDGDKVLLCTDGMSKMIPDSEIEETLKSAGSPDSICDALITKSNKMGGLDNITVIVYLYKCQSIGSQITGNQTQGNQDTGNQTQGSQDTGEQKSVDQASDSQN